MKEKCIRSLAEPSRDSEETETLSEKQTIFKKGGKHDY